MERRLEPEVMDDPAQALAYARADFAESNQRFADRCVALMCEAGATRAIDLGCGPADIPLRVARAMPGVAIVGVDASASMLDLGRDAARATGLGARVSLVLARLPGLPWPDASFDAVLSNSLLHHLPEPEPLWRELRRLGRPGAAVVVQDLFRPASEAEAQAIVDAAAADADPILRHDFFHSLLAAFTVDEVRAQLREAGLDGLRAEQTSERHVTVWGRL